MNRWTGPLCGVLVFAALARFAPGPGSCALPERVPDPVPAPGLGDSGRVAPVAPSARPDGFAMDPFALAPPPAAARATGGGASRHAVSGPAPTRPWKVTGLVGARAAVLVKPDGTSRVVSVGQRIDSAMVVGISAAGVELEDRGGRYLLKVR